MKMNRGKKVLIKAAKDFELANKYKSAREYIIASALYRRAAEKLLTALAYRKARKVLNKIDNIEYLVVQAKLPKEIKNELLSEMVDEKNELLLVEALEEHDELEMTSTAIKEEYNSTLSKYNVVKRLIDYASTRF
jgi:Mg/Co/Ni transporter MgtE